MSAPSRLKCLAPSEVEQALRQGILPLDTRAAAQFASFHLPGSIQVGLMGPFASWTAILIDPGQKLLLIVKDDQSAHEAHSRLARVGLHNVFGYAIADETSWSNLGIELSTIRLHRCEDTWRAMREGQPLQLVDVRSWAEWLRGHLPGALSRPLLEFQSQAADIALSAPTILYCQEGYRAMTAASMLLRQKNAEIGILLEGMEGWQLSGLPVEMPALV